MVRMDSRKEENDNRSVTARVGSTDGGEKGLHQERSSQDGSTALSSLLRTPANSRS